LDKKHREEAFMDEENERERDGHGIEGELRREVEL